MRSTLMAGAARALHFAHFLGLGPKAAGTRAADDDDTEDKDAAASADDEDIEDGDDDKPKDAKKSKKAAADEDNEDDEDKPKDSKKSKKAAADDECEDEDDDKPKDAKKSKKAAAEDDDDDKREEGKAEGRATERRRWGRVLNNPVSANNLAGACRMLANTEMSASAIVDVIETFPAAAKTSDLRSRMDGVKTPAIQPEGERRSSGDPDKAFAEQMAAAARKARGKA